MGVLRGWVNGEECEGGLIEKGLKKRVRGWLRGWGEGMG